MCSSGVIGEMIVPLSKSVEMRARGSYWSLWLSVMRGGGRLDTGHALSSCFVEILDFSVLALLSAHTEEFRVPRYQYYLCEFPICKISNKMVFPQCSSGSPDRGIRRDHTMQLSALLYSTVQPCAMDYSALLCGWLYCSVV